MNDFNNIGEFQVEGTNLVTIKDNEPLSVLSFLDEMKKRIKETSVDTLDISDVNSTKKMIKECNNAIEKIRIDLEQKHRDKYEEIFQALDKIRELERIINQKKDELNESRSKKIEELVKAYFQGCLEKLQVKGNYDEGVGLPEFFKMSSVSKNAQNEVYLTNKVKEQISEKASGIKRAEDEKDRRKQQLEHNNISEQEARYFIRCESPKYFDECLQGIVKKRKEEEHGCKNDRVCKTMLDTKIEELGDKIENKPTLDDFLDENPFAYASGYLESHIGIFLSKWIEREKERRETSKMQEKSTQELLEKERFISNFDRVNRNFNRLIGGFLKGKELGYPESELLRAVYKNTKLDDVKKFFEFLASESVTNSDTLKNIFRNINLL